MNLIEKEEFRKKHSPFEHKEWGCKWCSTGGECDAVKVLNLLDDLKKKICEVLSLGHPDAAELRDSIIKVLEYD